MIIVLSEYLTTADTDEMIRKVCAIVKPTDQNAQRRLFDLFSKLATAELVAYAYGQGRKDEYNLCRKEEGREKA